MVHKVVLMCYTILSVHEHIKWSRIFGRAIIATSQTLTSPVACLSKAPPPSLAFPPHSSFPIPLTEDWWLWAPFRMRSKLEGGERTRHENEWKRREHLLSYNQRGYGRKTDDSSQNNAVKNNKQALYLQINFIWIKKITIIKIYALFNKTQQKFLQFTSLNQAVPWNTHYLTWIK